MKNGSFVGIARKSAFDYLRELAIGTRVTVTADNEKPLRGVVGCTPDPSKVIVNTSGDSFFEFTAQSDIQYIRQSGRHRVHCV